MSRGYFGIGVYHPKTEQNIGTLMRSAYLYGAAFIFTVGRRYKHQATDTVKSQLHVPCFNFDTIDSLINHLPNGAPLIGIELDPRGKPLHKFHHPDRAVYMLGAEDHGLPAHVIDRCHSLVEIPSAEAVSMNVATAGSIVLYDRHVKRLVPALSAPVSA